jgi:hypothetical protein
MLKFRYWKTWDITTENQKSANRESGRAGESHPHAPTDPCVNLSIHTAPASLTLDASQPQADA